jgi:hypothetical protein
MSQNIKSKLFTTFTLLENLDSTIQEITKHYSILFNKIFVLEVEGKEEYILTYNVDQFNINSKVIPNTILLHRKKEFNVLYSINSLNTLISELNGGKIDIQYEINWEDYKNSILLVQDGVLKKMSTKIHKIITL